MSLTEPDHDDREESIEALAERDDWIGRVCQYMLADNPDEVLTDAE